MKLDSNNHSVFMLHYHLIMCIKYRNKVIDDKILRIILRWKNGIMIRIMFTYSFGDSLTQRSANLLMPINLQAAG